MNIVAKGHIGMHKIEKRIARKNASQVVFALPTGNSNSNNEKTHKMSSCCNALHTGNIF